MLKWGVERRLEFIEFRLFWEGGVNRSDLIDAFGVSVPQASKDLTHYQERAPLNAVYDKSARRYVAGPEFRPVFLDPDPDAYLMRLRSMAEGFAEPGSNWLSTPPDMDIALTLRRKIDTEVLRSVLAAVRDERSLELHYQSMNRDRPDPAWRRITPHAFGFDGLRWHVRAWCHETARFKDFLLSRVLGYGEFGEPGAGAAQDRLWQESFDIIIVPHPELSTGQQAVVANDYNMVDGPRFVLPRATGKIISLVGRRGAPAIRSTGSYRTSRARWPASRTDKYLLARSQSSAIKSPR